MKRNLQTPVSLAEIAQVLGAELRGDPSVTVRRLASLRKADTESISFLVRPQQREAAHASHAVAYIVSPRLVDDLPADANLLIDPDPYGAYARLAQWFDAQVNPRPVAGIAEGAHVHPDARVAASAVIEPGAVIGAGAVVGEGAWIGANTVLGAGASVGARTRLHANVTLGDDCSVGEDSLIHSGAVIGADGFGFAPKKGGGWTKIPQLGAVVIGNRVARLTTPSSKMAARSIISCKSPIMSGSEQTRPLRPAPASRAARSSASGSRSAEHPASSATSASATMPWSPR